MATFSIRRTIAAPPERVFALATDFANLPQVMPAIRRVEVLTPGPIGPGTQIRETRVMFGREASEVMTLSELDPPRGYVLSCESCGCRYRTEMRLSPQGQGGTEVELRFSAVPLTFVGKLLAVLMRPMLAMCAKQTAKDLEALCAAAEGRPMPSAAAPA